MTVQNTKLSGYNPNRRPSSIPSYLGLPRIFSWKKFANLLGLDTPNKLKCDCFCTGRSMVEMLGVLAIVGVLSVGAIAGYSKAMMKYRLNKFSEAINMLINNSLQLKDKVAYGTDMHKILEKTNSLPDGIYRSNSYLVDKYFKTNMYIYRNSNANPPYGGIGYEFAASAEGREICRTIVTAAKENAADLWLVEVGTRASQDIEDLTYSGHLYGDAYCGDQHKCLRKLNLDNIDALCSPCVAGTYLCTIFTLWSI